MLNTDSDKEVINQYVAKINFAKKNAANFDQFSQLYDHLVKWFKQLYLALSLLVIKVIFVKL